MLKSLITKHSEDIDCSALLTDLQFALKVSERSKQIYYLFDPHCIDFSVVDSWPSESPSTT